MVGLQVGPSRSWRGRGASTRLPRLGRGPLGPSRRVTAGPPRWHGRPAGRALTVVEGTRREDPPAAPEARVTGAEPEGDRRALAVAWSACRSGRAGTSREGRVSADPPRAGGARL